MRMRLTGIVATICAIVFGNGANAEELNKTSFENWTYFEVQDPMDDSRQHIATLDSTDHKSFLAVK